MEVYGKLDENSFEICACEMINKIETNSKGTNYVPELSEELLS